MRDQLIEILRCPACRAERSFSLQVEVRDEREVRDGTLTCGACRARFAIAEGIVGLLHDPPEYVTREAAGLERFAEVMRSDGWDRERIRRLPDVEDGYWYAQAVSFAQVLESVAFQPGQRLLDVGSNTCWASNRFARRGLEVIAMDIAVTEMQGLRTAEYFFEETADGGAVFFERLLSTMADPAIASASLDYVFCCEVLHHNDLPQLRRTFAELHRVLKPGGKLLVINETLKFPLNLKRDHGSEVAAYEGHEHCHFFHQYYLAARRAGFRVQVRRPPYEPFLSDAPVQLPIDLPAREVARELVRYALRRRRSTRRLYLAWKLLMAGELSLNMIATKAPSGAPPAATPAPLEAAPAAA